MMWDYCIQFCCDAKSCDMILSIVDNIYSQYNNELTSRLIIHSNHRDSKYPECYRVEV